MDAGKVILVVCLTIVGVVAINAILYLALRRGQEANAITLIRKAALRVRDPWNDEAKALDELSQRVAGLNQTKSDEISASDNTKSSSKDQV